MTMSDIHAEVIGATSCATIGCAGPPSVAMVWGADTTFGGLIEPAPAVEVVCATCADGYARRPVITRQVTFLPYDGPGS